MNPDLKSRLFTRFNRMRLLLSSAPLAFISFGLSLSLIQACKGLSFGEEDRYGLTLVSLRLDSEDLGQLNGQITSKRPARARILIDDDIKVTCEIAYAGRSSLDDYRKSYDLFFCGKTYNNRSSYRLSAQSVDRSLLRSKLGYEAFATTGFPVPRVDFASAYLNQRFLGYYLLLETVDREYFDRHGFSIRELYKARFGNAGFRRDFVNRPKEAFSDEGGNDNYALIQAINSALWSKTKQEDFVTALEVVLDTERFISYMATALYLAHWDGFANNYFLVLDRARDKLIIAPWDLDRIWERTDPPDHPQGLIHSNALLGRMLEVPHYRQQFHDVIDALLKNYPAETIITQANEYRERTREAYNHDQVLPLKAAHDEVVDDLISRVRAWDEKIKAYQAQYQP